MTFAEMLLRRQNRKQVLNITLRQLLFSLSLSKVSSVRTSHTARLTVGTRAPSIRRLRNHIRSQVWRHVTLTKTVKKVPYSTYCTVNGNPGAGYLHVWISGILWTCQTRILLPNTDQLTTGQSRCERDTHKQNIVEKVCVNWNHPSVWVNWFRPIGLQLMNDAVSVTVASCIHNYRPTGTRWNSAVLQCNQSVRVGVLGDAPTEYCSRNSLTCTHQQQQYVDRALRNL